MDSPHQMRLLQSRLERAQAEADEMARVADVLANNYAAALNRLQPHDPEFVAEAMGTNKAAAEPAPAVEEAPAT